MLVYNIRQESTSLKQPEQVNPQLLLDPTVMRQIFPPERNFVPPAFGNAQTQSLPDALRVFLSEPFFYEKQLFDQKARQNQRQIQKQLQKGHIFIKKVYIILSRQRDFKSVITGSAGAAARMINDRLGFHAVHKSPDPGPVT